MNNQAGCSFLFQSISIFFSCTWKITIWQSVQPPQPPCIYQLRPSIPQGRVYQQLHLRDLVKGAPSVKPWETVSALWYVSSTIQLFVCFFKAFDVGHHHLYFVYLGLVFKFRGSEGISFSGSNFCIILVGGLGASIYQNPLLERLLIIFITKILYLIYLAKHHMSQPAFVTREMTGIDAYRRKTSLIHIST